MSTEPSFNELLSLLETENKSNQYDLFIPSINQYVKCLPLTATHSKNIIKTTLEGAFANNQFNIMMFNVLNDILVDKTFIDKINLFDKQIIFLQLRIINISDTIDIAHDDKTIKFNLKDYTTSLMTNRLFDDVTVNDKNFNITIGIPSIKTEYLFENNLYNTKLSSLDEQNIKALKSSFGPMFIYGIAQYIKELTINGITRNVSNDSIEQRVALMEKLPSGISNKIINAIEKNYTSHIANITKVKITSDDKQIDTAFDINAGLFVN